MTIFNRDIGSLLLSGVGFKVEFSDQCLSAAVCEGRNIKGLAVSRTKVGNDVCNDDLFGNRHVIIIGSIERFGEGEKFNILLDILHREWCAHRPVSVGEIF